MTIKQRRLSYALGAEICDIDVMHQALGDFDETQSRYMERSTVLGTPLGYVAGRSI